MRLSTFRAKLLSRKLKRLEEPVDVPRLIYIPKHKSNNLEHSISNQEEL